MQQENARHDLRELSWHVDDDGSHVFKARLTQEQGERVIQAIQAAMDQQFPVALHRSN